MARILLAVAFLLGISEQTPADEAVAPRKSGTAVIDRDHPSGETPLERMVALAHTEALPECDKVAVFAVYFPEQSIGERRKPVPIEKAFPLRPYGGDAWIEAQKTLDAQQSKAVCASWRQLRFDSMESAFCHYPVYGLRFYRKDQLLFETSICWKCSNFYLPDLRAVDPKYDQPEDALTRYQWYGFATNKESKQLLELLQKLLPHPRLEEEPAATKTK